MDKDWMRRLEALMVERIEKERQQKQEELHPNTRKATGARLDRSRVPDKGVDEMFQGIVAANIAWETARTRTVFRKMLEDFFNCPDYDFWGNC